VWALRLDESATKDMINSLTGAINVCVSTSGLSHLIAPALLIVVVVRCSMSLMAARPKSPRSARLCSSTNTLDYPSFVRGQSERKRNYVRHEDRHVRTLERVNSADL
jgi:hypothetical protein